ncbi:hypothetical protein [Alteromonas macleodii]|nr:hypothetical protein [Alteromonas macleodii]
MEILLVDDHAIVREGFSTLLSSVLEGAVVTNAKNAQIYAAQKFATLT